MNARPFGVVKKTKVEPSAPADVTSAVMLIGRKSKFVVPNMSKNAKAPSRIINDTKGVRPRPVFEASICFAVVKKRMLVCVTKATDLSNNSFRQPYKGRHKREIINRPKLNDGS